MAIEYLDAAPAAAAPTPGSKFEYLDDEKPKSLAGFGQNLVTDAKDTAAGMANMVPALMEHPIDTVTGMVKNAPSGIINEGKRLGVGELLTGHPINAIEKLGNAMYDKPLTTGLEVAPVAFGAGKAIFGAGAEGADAAGAAAKAGLAEDAVKAAPDVPPAGPAGPSAAAEPLKTPPPAAEPPPAAAEPPPAGKLPFQDQATKAASDLKNYVSGKYESYAGKPGGVASVADYLQEKAQMMANQQLGATPLQARQIGHEGMRAVGQYALDQDIVSPGTGLRGMRAKNAALLDAAGEKIGALRQEAEALRDPKKFSVDVLQDVRGQLDSKYARGAYSGQSGQYAKALQELEDAPATLDGVSDAVSRLNRAANEAARDKQPHTPFTDVANVASRVNNERIRAILGPEKATEYDEALKNFGVNKKISHFLERKSAGEVKRIGAGSFTSNMIQKGMDEMGYRVGAKALSKVSGAVLKNPALAKDLPSLFKEFIHHVDLPETPDALAHGGVVADDELNDFLSKKYGKGE